MKTFLVRIKLNFCGKSGPNLPPAVIDIKTKAKNPEVALVCIGREFSGYLNVPKNAIVESVEIEEL